ncbi:MAG TPA: hypothetical protein VIB48_04130 [Acidimicrobiia bacterium]
MLNPECTKVSCLAGDGQERWLRADLAATHQPCIMGVTHHPRYTCGRGTGGKSQTGLGPREANSAAGSAFTDSFSGTCH